MGNESLSCNYCTKLYKKSELKQSAVIQVYNNNFYVKGNLNFNKQSEYKKVEIAAVEFCSSTGIGVHYNPVIMRLLAFKHNNVFEAFASLPKQNRIQFIDKIGQIYLDLMDSLYQFLILNQDRKRVFKQISRSQLSICQGIDTQQIKVDDRFDYTNTGTMLLRSGKVAIVFMCGGPSSRFFFQDKFLHPLQIHNCQTTILEILFEKLRDNFRAQLNQIVDLPIFVLGNQSNINQIQDYVKQNNFFGFNKQNIYFSEIPSLPILDKDGKICLNFQYNYLRRPKGSACYLEQVLHPRLFQILTRLNVEYLHFNGTQNLGQSPGDPLFLGLTHMFKRKVSIKCTQPQQPYQKFDRIFGYKNHVRMFDLNGLQIIGIKQLYESCIAMNSLVFSFDALPEIVETFNNNLQLAGLYRPLKIKQNIYDFSFKKPLIDRQCWAFEKDIKDVLSCVKSPLVIRVNRKEFIPLISYKQDYSIQEACQKYMESHPLKIRNSFRGDNSPKNLKRQGLYYSSVSSHTNYSSKSQKQYKQSIKQQ